MVFGATDGQYHGFHDVHEIVTVIVSVVSFFLGFVTIDYDLKVVLVLTSPGARPDGIVDFVTHQADCGELGRITAMLFQAAWYNVEKRADGILLVMFVEARG